MLFPDGIQYDEGPQGSLLRLMDKSYTEAILINQTYWAQADIDTRFEAGDATACNELYSGIPLNQQRNFNFNRIRRIVNMISGHQRRNRKSTIIVPVENSDEQAADQFTKIFMWLNQQEDVLGTISESFEGALVTGMNLLQVWVDYRSDPISGSIKVDNCPYNSFLIDPFFRKSDLSDCNYIWKRTYLTHAECVSLLPDKKDDILSFGCAGTGSYGAGSDGAGPGAIQDGKFQFMPENYQLNSSNLMAYDEFYYRTYRKQKLLVDSETGETLEWESKNNDALKRFLDMYPSVEVVDSMVPTVKLGIVIQGRVMYDDINALGIDTYPFVPVLAYYNPQMTSYHLRLQGVVRGLRDPQFLYNRRKVIEFDTLESQVNTGWKYKEGALVNPKDVFQSGQGRGIAIKNNAQMTDVEQILPPQVPPTTIELSKIMGEEINQISGVNEELTGSAVDDKAGVLSMLRQGAGLTTLQGLFDRLDTSQKLLGKIILKVIQNNFTPGKVQRIIEQEPSQQFYNKFYGKYDAAVEEGVNTTTQKQLQFAQLLHLKEVGIPIPDDVIIEASTVQNKSAITKSMEATKQQQQQQEQQAQQVQMQEIQSRAKLAEARVEEQMALANERNTRSQSNLGLAEERIHESIKDDTQAKLNYVKTLSELEDMDLSKIRQLIEMANMIQQPDAPSVQMPQAPQEQVPQGPTQDNPGQM